MTEPATEAAFERLADDTLRRMVDALADLDDERLEADLESGVLTLRYEDGARHVVNSHRAARQIWFAADASAWHFSWDGASWRSTRGPEELWALVSERVGRRLGRAVRLGPSS